MSPSEPEGTLESAGGIQSAYEQQRDRELVASTPWVVLTVVGIVAAYATANCISRPEDFSASLPFYAGQIGVMLLIYAIPRIRYMAHAELIALAADVSFTLFLVGHLSVPSTTITGASTTICMKMLTSASFLPWRASVQLASSAASLVFYEAALRSRFSELGEMVAAMILPLLAGMASVAATSVADRRRRDAFDKGIRLERSEATLRRTSEALAREARVKAALATVGRHLLSHSERQSVLDEICRLTAETLHAHFSHVWLRDSPDGAFVAVAHVAVDGAEVVDTHWDEVRALRITATNAGHILQRLERNGMAHLQAADYQDVLPAELHRRYGLRRAIFIGLKKSDALFGIVTAGQVDSAATFGEVEQRIADGIGQLASLAIENARLLRDLEHANQLKQDFMATMSHELRTPLNAIIGYAALLADGEMGELEADAQTAMQRIQTNAMRLLEMIQATLDLNRLESGRLRLVRRPLQPAQLLAELASAVEHLAQPEVEIRWSIAPDLPEIATDPSALRTILLNLVTNALKFTAAGWVDVAVAVDGDRLEFSVKDSGPGIPPDTLGKIFEPYWQGSDSGGGLREGFGLGLYIVHQLANALGADISVDSQLGVGSTFCLRLPLSPPDTAAIG